MLNGEESIANLVPDPGIKAGKDNNCQSNNQNYKA